MDGIPGFEILYLSRHGLGALSGAASLCIVIGAAYGLIRLVLDLARLMGRMPMSADPRQRRLPRISGRRLAAAFVAILALGAGAAALAGAFDTSHARVYQPNSADSSCEAEGDCP